MHRKTVLFSLLACGLAQAGTSQWHKSEKLEIRKVSTMGGDFSRFQRVELRIDAGGTYATPFDPDEIAIDAIIKAPSGKPLRVPAFLYQPFELEGQDTMHASGTLILRMQEPFRKDENAIRNLLVATPDGQYLPLGQFCDIKVESGASFIYRESNSRYIGVQFSVEGRDLASAVGEARKKVAGAVKLPIGYKFDWGGEYKNYLASRAQMIIILPLTVILILVILFALYGNFKFPIIIFLSVLVTQPVGGLLALWLTHTNFSVSSMLGFVALMGVAVQTSVILYSFINKLRLEGRDIMQATLEASVLRLRPIMMTAMVACFGMLPAAMSTGIGSDSQKPFAIVIVGGLASRLVLSVFLSPVLYALVARDGDTLQV